MPNPFPAQILSVDEVTAWIQGLDTDGNKRISKTELRTALRKLEVLFPGLKGQWVMWRVDADGSGYIDTKEEFERLANYVKKNWEKRIVSAKA